MIENHNDVDETEKRHPAREQIIPKVFGCMAGTAEIVGDLEAPVFPPSSWKAL